MCSTEESIEIQFIQLRFKCDVYESALKCLSDWKETPITVMARQISYCAVGGYHVNI